MSIINGIINGSGGGGGGGTITISGDGYASGTSSLSLTVTEAQAGQIKFGSPSGLITLAGDSTGPGLSQPAPSTVLVPVNMTVTPQAPNGGSGSAAQNTPGSLVVALAAAGSVGTAGNEGSFQVTRGGTVIATIGLFNGASNGGSLWIGNAGTANSTSYAIDISSNFSTTAFNSAGSFLELANAGTANLQLDSTTSEVGLRNTWNLAVGGFNGTYGGGSGVLQLLQAHTAPTASQSAGAILYASSDGYFNIYPQGVTSPNFRLSQSDLVLQNVALNLPIRSVSSTPYQVDSLGFDHFVLMSTSSGAKTVTLPPPEVGRTVTVKDSSGNAGTHNITVDPYLSEHIDGAASATISTNYGAARYTSDGTNWFSV